MTGTITKIDPLKSGHRHPDGFHRIYFKLEPKGWAKCDVCPSYRNFARWQPLMLIGMRLGELQMRNDETVDADSHPVKLPPNPEQDTQPELF